MPVVAATNVSGDILTDTTWSKAGSPYIVKSSILVVNGVTLTIEPGVAVKFDGFYALAIDGALIARGTGAENITFTTNKPGQYWGGLEFRAGSSNAVYDVNGNYISGSILQYCLVEYTSGTTWGNAAIRMTDAHPLIDHCTVNNNQTRGIHACNLSRCLKITNNTISNNTTSGLGDGGSGGGIRLEQASYPDPNPDGPSIIYNNIIANNKATDDGATGGGIEIFSVPYGQGVLITKNLIRNNVAPYGGGIITQRWLDQNPVNEISHNVIIENSAMWRSYLSGGGGIGGSASIIKNVISGNLANDGGGIINYDWGCAGCPDYIISNNSIVRNVADNYSAFSISLPGGESPTVVFQYNLVTANKATGAIPTYSSFIWDKQDPEQTRFKLNYNNIYGDKASYELKNNCAYGTPDVNAENNWWGAATQAGVQAKIYDWHQDLTLGLVDYNPWEAVPRTDVPISPPLNLKAAQVKEGIRLTWQANPESDLAGYNIYWGATSGYPYANVRNVGKVTAYTFTDLPPGQYYFAVTAYDTDYNPANDAPDTIVNENQTEGHESWFSEEPAFPKDTISGALLLLLN